MSEEQLEELRRTMLQQSFLFDDPYAYQCGVQDALAAVRTAMSISTIRDGGRSRAMAASG